MEWIYRDLPSGTIPTFDWRDFCKSRKRLCYEPIIRDEARKENLEMLKQEF
jgi:hypothetical protein